MSNVPLFDASANDGDIYLQAGIDSTAQYVSAGGMNNVVNGVSVTSQANFLTIEGIFATGQAAVTMNSGALVEYDGGNFFNQFYDESLQAQPDIVEIINDMRVQEPIAIPGIISGQVVSLTSPYNIGTASSPFQTDATSGLAVDATATSPTPRTST